MSELKRITIPIRVKDITEFMKMRDDGRTLIKFTTEGIFPVYSRNLSALYTLMEWPLIGESKEKKMIQCCAALLPHGKIFAAEIFFMLQGLNESSGIYMGTSKVLTVELPNNTYDESYDDEISDRLWEIGCEVVQIS